MSNKPSIAKSQVLNAFQACVPRSTAPDSHTPPRKTGPKLTKQQQAVCSVSTPRERRELLAELAAKLDISSSTRIVS